MAVTLYHPTILDRDRAPRCAGPLPEATHEATVDNPLCGDVLTMRLVLRAGERSAHSETHAAPGARVLAAAFEGRGCAVSRAAASLWAERILHCSPAEVAELIARFTCFVAEPVEAPLPQELGELVVLAGVRAAKSRRGCATLAARALTEALRGADEALTPALTRR